MKDGSRSRGATACSLMILLSLFGSFPLAEAVASSSTSTTTTTSIAQAQAPSAGPTALALSVLAPKLPADGGAYPAVVVSLQSSGGKAALALNNTLVFLTSSQVNVGSVLDRVTITRGTGFALVNFTSSTTPGSTTISASSVGLSAASGQVATVSPSGLATRLKVIPVPSSQLANPGANGTVIVEAVDSAGLPSKVTSNAQVALTSSNNNVASLLSTSLTVSAGAVFVSAPYLVGFSTGVTSITASASGFNSGAGTITVQGQSPLALKISAQPSPMSTSTKGRLVVILTDGANPTRAPAPISVSISSSNTTVASTDTSATIQKGSIYAVASLTSGSSVGTANITASSAGLKSDFALVSVMKPGNAVKLKLFAAPNPVLADKSAYDSIVVALTDSAGNPATSSAGVAVILTSSNSTIGNVGSSLSIPPGSTYAVATFASTFSVGATSLTAIAQNFQSANYLINSFGPIPAKLVVQSAPMSLPADGGNFTALEIMVVDAAGLPAIAPIVISVQLSSSRTDIAQVNPSVVIAPGQSYVLTSVVTSSSPGIANITATSSGFGSSSTGFTTSSPAPTQLGMYAAPANGIQSLGQTGDAILAVQLQDTASSPARALQDTDVVVTGSNSSILAKPLQLVIPAGGNYAWTFVKTAAPGTNVLTASTPGLGSATASLTELSLPIGVTVTSSLPVISLGTTATIQVSVQAMGAPLKGANVVLSTSSGVVSPSKGMTDGSGLFSTTFVPQTNGVATITAVVTNPIIGNQTQGTNILVTRASGASTTSNGGGGLGILGTVLPLFVVLFVVIILAVAVRRITKRRRRLPEGEEEESEETDAV